MNVNPARYRPCHSLPLTANPSLKYLTTQSTQNRSLAGEQLRAYWDHETVSSRHRDGCECRPRNTRKAHETCRWEDSRYTYTVRTRPPSRSQAERHITTFGSSRLENAELLRERIGGLVVLFCKFTYNRPPAALTGGLVAVPRALKIAYGVINHIISSYFSWSG